MEWMGYLKGVLPPWFWQMIERDFTKEKQEKMEEIRLRLDRCASLTIGGENVRVSCLCDEKELQGILVRCCRGSLYAYRESIKNGYVPLPYGMRLGVVGQAVVEGQQVTGVGRVSALVFRIPRRVVGAAKDVVAFWRARRGCGILVCATVAGGKTTLLKDFIVQISSGEMGVRCAVVDTRGELCPDTLGELVDVLEGYPRGVGLEIALRTMSPQVIVCDELGHGEIEGVMEICHSGIPLVASLHARDRDDLLKHHLGRQLLDTGAFQGLCFIDRLREGFRTRMEVYRG